METVKCIHTLNNLLCEAIKGEDNCQDIVKTWANGILKAMNIASEEEKPPDETNEVVDIGDFGGECTELEDDDSKEFLCAGYNHGSCNDGSSMLALIEFQTGEKLHACEYCRKKADSA